MPKRSSSPAMAEEQRLAKKNTSSGHGDDRGEEEVVLVGDEEEDEDLVLPGFRFHPTDEELVTFYLRRKVAGKRLSIEIIKDFDIYKHDPWDLPKASTISGEKELYFFCLRGRKYRNSIRPNRVTGSGFWKATGIDRPIHSAAAGRDSIGLKKSLVFYRGSAGKGTKTEWMMHEFRLPPRPDAADASPSNQEAEVWTICRIFKRSITYKKQPQTQEQHVAAAAAAAATQPDSGSSVTAGSPESETSDEYMTSHSHIPAAPPAPVNNDDYGYGYNQQYHQEQWNSSAPRHPMATAAAAALPSPGTAAAFQYGALCSPTAAMNPYDLFYKDGCSWDDIGRMVMELTDPSEFYDGLTTQ